MFVEHSHFGFHWAEPLRTGRGLEVKQVGHELRISGLLPRYLTEDHQSDLIWQYEIAAKYRAVGKPRTAEESPDIRFANADTDEKLIAFVQRFGPVVAQCAYSNLEKPEEGVPEPRWPLRLFAVQDMRELRSEHSIYRSALALCALQSSNRSPDDLSAQGLIGEIAARIVDWPKQREREKSQRGREPHWNLGAESLKRVEQLKSARPDGLLPPTVDGRIVICELLNSFRPMVFPNPLELHSSIKYGIRPLLYSLLRRQFLTPRDFAGCANTQCRNFFNIERAGQQFCCSECSIHQRQRTYWMKQGKKLRKKRVEDRRKAKK
jgi:hypothetical protein